MKLYVCFYSSLYLIIIKFFFINFILNYIVVEKDLDIVKKFVYL